MEHMDAKNVCNKYTNIPRVLKFGFANFNVKGNVISGKFKFCHEKTRNGDFDGLVWTSGNAAKLFSSNCVSQGLEQSAFLHVKHLLNVGLIMTVYIKTT